LGNTKGGGQRSLYLLIKCLNKEKFTPYLFVPNERELSSVISELGIKVSVLHCKRVKGLNIIAVIKGILNLKKIVKENNIDIIHVENPRELFYAAMVRKFFRYLCHHAS